MKFISVVLFCFVAEISAYYGYPVCPPGWVSSKAGSCYEFNQAAKSWQAARLDCQNKGAELAQVASLAKAAQLRSIRTALGNQNNYYWIGAKQNSARSRDFSWVSGGAFSTSLWFPGEPSNHHAYDLQCVDMCSAGQQMKMCDWPCSGSLSYICEKWLY